MSGGVALTKQDYDLLKGIVKNKSSVINTYSLKKLTIELSMAKVVEKDKLPGNIVCLNSEVRFSIEGENREVTIKLVLPKESDIKKQKISVLAPMGIALLGYKTGDTVAWEVPGGIKTFKILDVKNGS